MKNLALTLTFLLVGSIAFAQKGKKEVITSYTTKDGTTYNVGDTVWFGTGSNSNGDFRYVKIMGNFVTNPQFWGASLNDRFSTIERFQKTGSDKVGYATYIIFPLGPGGSFINIESAITSGELITPASKLKAEQKNQPATTIIQQQSSIADELKKYKELLDAGIINQDEFDAQKKKLLEGK